MISHHLIYISLSSQFEAILECNNEKQREKTHVQIDILLENTIKHIIKLQWLRLGKKASLKTFHNCFQKCKRISFSTFSTRNLTQDVSIKPTTFSFNEHVRLGVFYLKNNKNKKPASDWWTLNVSPILCKSKCRYLGNSFKYLANTISMQIHQLKVLSNKVKITSN